MGPLRRPRAHIPKAAEAVKSVFFAVNRSQYRYFSFLVAQFRGEAQVVYARRSLLPSWRAWKQLSCSDLSPIVEQKLVELTARKRLRGSWRLHCYRGLYFVLGVIAYLRYWRPIARSGATVLAVWNGNFFRQGIALAIAGRLGLRCVFFENGPLPDTTTLDARGVNYNNSVPRSRGFFAARPMAGELPRTLVPRAPRRPGKFVARSDQLPARYVFVPFQIDHDTQLTHFSPWIRNMQHLFAEVTAAAREAGDGDLVFKEHPSAAQDYPTLYRAIEGDPKLHLLNHAATQTLIEKAEAVITINSTVGLEALLLGKKVIVLGQAFYAIDGITCQAASREQLATALRELDSWQIDRELIDGFLHYLQREYALPGSWKSPQIQHAIAVEERLGVCHG